MEVSQDKIHNQLVEVNGLHMKPTRGQAKVPLSVKKIALPWAEQILFMGHSQTYDLVCFMILNHGLLNMWRGEILKNHPIQKALFSKSEN